MDTLDSVKFMWSESSGVWDCKDCKEQDYAGSNSGFSGLNFIINWLMLVKKIKKSPNWHN